MKKKRIKETALIILMLSFNLFFVSCSKKQKIQEMYFENLAYYLNDEIYFTVKNGIYNNRTISFEDMKIVFPNGHSKIKDGSIDLKSLKINKINNRQPLEIYYNDLVIIIRDNPIIDLKKAEIEGYDVIIQNLKKKEKFTRAYKIKIDIKENKIHTYKNRGLM